MTKKSNTLRLNAEDELKTRKPEQYVGEADTLKLIHELQVHQIELEMQNDELVQEKEQVFIDLEKYIDLYDFGSSGFLTISHEGIIVDLNFVAAKLLGKERRYLKNTSLELYIHPRGVLGYNQLMNNAFDSDSRNSTELYLSSKTDTPTCVQIDTIAAENNNQFSITMVDKTEYNRLEVLAKIKLNDLKQINNYFHYRELKLMDIKEQVNDLLIKAGCEEQYLI